MSTVSPELLTRLRAELDADRESLVAELRAYGADPDSERVDRIAGVDDNFADSASATAERSEALAFIENARERLAAVDEALARMDAGSYGVCADCGKPIPEARLQARSLSVRCVECAAARS